MNKQNFSLVLAFMTTALMAGLFYGFSVAVNPGLGMLTDQQYIAAFQAINIAIINPAFMFCFLGAGAFLVWATVAHRRSPRFRWLLIATLLYVIGVLFITSAFNVPMNDAIAKFQLAGATPQQMAAARTQFEGPWNGWHTVRTWANILAALACIIAVLQPAKYQD
ncbi:anthrone oxygenase family protein [Chitinophaga vietnamensis]|uniref:anthrone oxygenase family protein n=1 Tax=Chitinophaga vietnamensis TaxID=2593957 RepID=UPI00117809B2|nr:anthrone oxygenase family protein [Chitinophaga vietnamensis]